MFTTSNSSTAELITGNSSAAIINIPTTPATSPSSAFTEFVLRQIGCAKLRAQITVNQIEMAATALSAGMITPEAAILILAETGISVSS